MTKKQHYMTEEERYKLEAYREAGKSVAWIAGKLGFCRQTIYNELKRGSYIHTCEYWDEVRYSADKGQQIHNYNQTAKGRPLKISNDHAYANRLEQLMLGVQDDSSIDKLRRYSPAAALAQTRKEGYQTRISTATLYSYIKKRVFLKLQRRDLWAKPKKQKEDETKRIAHPKLPSIEDRPDHIRQRLEPGHWEMDLIIGKEHTTACLLNLYERYSRRVLIFKLPNRKAATVRAIFDRLERSMGKKAFRERFKSITTDNGPEFLEYELLVKSIYGGERFQVYYCHPYSAYEKGGIENHNRMVRRWFPKGTDFTRISKRRIRQLQTWMNNYPRRILGWATPNEAAA